MVFCRGASKEPIQQLCSPHTHNHYFLIPSTSASAPPIYEQIDSSSQSPNTSQTTITSAHPIRSDPWTPIGFSSIVPSAPPLPSHYTVLPEIHSSVADINNGTHSLPPSPKNPEPSLGRRVKTAPLIGRGCTDVCCCMLFSVFLAGWAAVAFLALMWGRPERLIHPTDSLGRMCGFDRPGAYNMSSRPYVLYFDITKCASYVTVLTGCSTPQICVETCPTTYFSYLQLQTLSPADFRLQVRSKMVCDDSVDKNQIANFQELKQYVDRDWCAAYTVNSASILGRCMPQVFLDVEKTVQTGPNSLNQIIATLGNDQGLVPNDQQIGNSSQVLGTILNSHDVVQKIAADLSVSWWQISALLGIAAVISFLWTVVMRFLGGMMIWLSIFVLLGVLLGGSGFCWYRYKTLHDAGAVNDYSFQPMISVYFEMPTTWMVFAIGLSILFVLVFIIFLFVRSRIKIAVALIAETSSALGHMLSTLFFPLFPFVLHIIVFALWGSITIWLASSGQENCRKPSQAFPNDIQNGDFCDCNLLGTNQEANCRYVNITRDNNRLLALQLYNLFGCFWATCFVSALSDMTLAGAFASHYFAFRKPRDVPSFPVLRAMGRSIRYHIGTLAFGALILTIVKFFQVILDFAYDKLKGAKNPVTKFLYRALSCFFFCLETFLRFLTKNAYIMTAIYGKGFCRASRDSFSLLARNIIRVVVVNRTTSFLLFVGKALITIGMGAVAYYYFSGRWIINGLPHINLYYFFVPVIIVLVGTYFICDLFFEVYDMGVDTTFLCFLEDSETNDGSMEKPFYMSDSLKKILGKENKF
ncbi:plasma-membrane choline transporter domain-containing protein [Ditylenchus destructor]|uniref:Plasma-membrane choline transporter domain-containing protein n=1 Tax=Ditylenchus destructor TaxID=166010 RepID=A0AAD4NB36_9BILA|nr:plasma-membrane choline transporter domain-containing protein [Ditylenchus destructor]